MIALLIIIIIIALEFLPIDTWLRKHNLSIAIPIFFSLLWAFVIIMSFTGFAKAFHWYDYTLTIFAFVYEWIDFLGIGKK